MRWEQQIKLMIHSSYRPFVDVKKEKKKFVIKIHGKKPLWPLYKYATDNTSL